MKDAARLGTRGFYASLRRGPKPRGTVRSTSTRPMNRNKEPCIRLATFRLASAYSTIFFFGYGLIAVIKVVGGTSENSRTSFRLPYRAVFKPIFNPRRWDEEVGSSTTSCASHNFAASQVSHPDYFKMSPRVGILNISNG
jgi:hypothetical protein